VADANQTAWWRKSEQLAAILLAGSAALMCVPLLLANGLDRSTAFGLPLGMWLIALVAPIVLAIAIFWYADRQRIVDHRYHVAED